MKTLRTLKSTVSNEYFPAAAVLSGVVLFWALGVYGGLSLQSTNQTLLTTITWLLFVYTAAVLSPVAGMLAASDLIRRWLRHRPQRAGTPAGNAPV